MFVESWLSGAVRRGFWVIFKSVCLHTLIIIILFINRTCTRALTRSDTVLGLHRCCFHLPPTDARQDGSFRRQLLSSAILSDGLADPDLQQILRSTFSPETGDQTDTNASSRGSRDINKVRP